ncbi:hypothetical protein [Micromonospora sp. NPDC000668]|uniref:hypothetical protein n=1 Tax=Micromonospora sp. NPDC000668 TaxID=3364219 RepID=UPI00368ECC5B
MWTARCSGWSTTTCGSGCRRGFTCAGAGATYWVGEALHTLDYQDAGPKPDTTGRTTKTLALNSAHLARLLAEQPYPPPDAKGAGREPA